jgi:hypothetical protein
MASRRSKAKKVCSIEGCETPSYCYGRCLKHYTQLRKMNADARLAELAKPKHTLPKWEYLGHEDELIAEQEKNNE